jgi:hypothetical protein
MMASPGAKGAHRSEEYAGVEPELVTSGTRQVPLSQVTDWWATDGVFKTGASPVQLTGSLF